MDRLELLKARLESYLQAERAILSGAQSYTIGDRQLTRANLKDIQAQITSLLEEINLLELKNGRVKRVIFID